MTAYQRRLMWERIDGFLAEAVTWLAIIVFWLGVLAILAGIGIGAVMLLAELGGLS